MSHFFSSRIHHTPSTNLRIIHPRPIIFRKTSDIRYPVYANLHAPCL